MTSRFRPRAGVFASCIVFAVVILGGAPAARAESAAPDVPADSTLRRIERSLRGAPGVRLHLRDRVIVTTSVDLGRKSVEWEPRSGDERWGDPASTSTAWGDVVSIEASTTPARRGARRGAIAGAVIGLAAGAGLASISAIDGEFSTGQLVGVGAVMTTLGALTGAGLGGGIDAVTHVGAPKPGDSAAWRVVWQRE